MRLPAPRYFLASILLHDFEWSGGGKFEFRGGGELMVGVAIMAIRADAETKVRRAFSACE